MSKIGRWVVGLTLLMAAGLLAEPARAFEHRRGTPSVGVKAQYGMQAGDSRWQRLFDSGWGIAISVRQYVARNRAVGLSAEQQSFDSKNPDLENAYTVTDDATFDEMEYQLLMFDYYAYFRRMYRRTPYLVFSGGIYRPQFIDKFRQIGTNIEGEHVSYHHKEGFVLRVGGGLEWFLGRKASVDGTLSGYYFSAPGLDGNVFTVQLSLGMHLYTR